MSAVLIVLALAACSPSEPAEGQDNASVAPAPASSARATTPATSTGTPASLSEDEVVELVNAVVKKHQLTSLPEQCLSYMVEDTGGNTIDIDVREKHDDTCGGDPGVAPRLFSFKLDRVSHQLSTDAMDRADGEFQPID